MCVCVWISKYTYIWIGYNTWVHQHLDVIASGSHIINSTWRYLQHLYKERACDGTATEGYDKHNTLILFCKFSYIWSVLHACVYTTSLHICIIHQRPYYKSMYCSLVIYVCVGWGGKFICDWLVGSCILRIPQYIFRRQVDGWVGFGYLSVWYVRIYSFWY